MGTNSTIVRAVKGGKMLLMKIDRASYEEGVD